MRVRSCDDINKRNGMGKKNEDKTTIGSYRTERCVVAPFFKELSYISIGKNLCTA